MQLPIVGLILACFVTGASVAATHPAADQAASSQQTARENWPQWRGPLGTGVAPVSDAPTHFSAARGVKWKTEIPGRGMSSPIVWGEHVFVTTAVATEPPAPADRPRRRRRMRLVPHEYRLLAIDRRTGEVLWSRTAITATPHERYHRSNSSFANASPVTDGERVYAFFGSQGLYAYDFEGRLMWARDFGVKMESFNHFGESSSPALHGDTLVLLFDHQQQSFIEAVDKRTGETKWRRLRDEETSWTSPTIVEHDGRLHVVASAGNFITSYDLLTGEEIWRASGMTPHPVPTPVAGNGLLIAASGSAERRVMAIRLDASGDLDGTDAIVWELDRAAPYNPSPLLWGDYLYLVRDGGLSVGTSRLSLFDAGNGRAHYTHERLPGAYTIKASPVGAGGKVYLVTEEGDVIVLRRSPEIEVIAVNSFDERFIASPAIARGELFLRSARHLFCIAGEEGSRSP